MRRLERVAVVAKAPEGTRGSRGGYHNRTVSPYRFVGILNLAHKNVLCKNHNLQRAVGDVGPYRLVKNLCFANRYLFCKIDGFIKVSLKHKGENFMKFVGADVPDGPQAVAFAAFGSGYEFVLHL